MVNKQLFLETSDRNSLSLCKVILQFGCLGLPVVLFMLTGHPAFIVIFISGMAAVGVGARRRR